MTTYYLDHTSIFTTEATTATTITKASTVRIVTVEVETSTAIVPNHSTFTKATITAVYNYKHSSDTSSNPDRLAIIECMTIITATTISTSKVTATLTKTNSDQDTNSG